MYKILFNIHYVFSIELTRLVVYVKYIQFKLHIANYVCQIEDAVLMHIINDVWNIQYTYGTI